MKVDPIRTHRVWKSKHKSQGWLAAIKSADIWDIGGMGPSEKMIMGEKFSLVTLEKKPVIICYRSNFL